MPIFKKNHLIIPITLSLLFFLYLIRSTLTPFILAAVFAYLLNPLVTLLVNFKLSKNISVVLIFLSVISLISYFITELGFVLVKEAREMSLELRGISYLINNGLNNLPDWLKNYIFESLGNINLQNYFSVESVLPYFSGAFSGVFSLFTFLVSFFYFLRDGDLFISKIKEIFGISYSEKPKEIFKKITNVLNEYLRGYIILIFIMGLIYFILLSFLGVKYATILAIIGGLAEVVPVIGPFFAGFLAVTISVFDGFSPFGLPAHYEGVVVIALYLLINQIESIFIIPHLLGRATKLHPLLIIFSVIAGGYLYGIIGTILAIPAAAVIRIILSSLLSKNA